MDPSIESILRQNYTDGIYHTHVSLIQPHGKYQFNRQTEEEFWRHYCETIDLGKYNMGIAEKPQQYLPILVDVDLKISEECNPMTDDNLYTLDQVRCVVAIYQKIIRDIVEECDDNTLTCVFLNKPPYKVSSNTTTYIKNGFHLHFPYCFLDKGEQEIHLIPRVKELMKDEMVFSNLGIENSADVIDDSCCSVPWLLYGSKKEESATPYLFSKVFNNNLEEVSLEDAFKHYMIYDKHEKAITITKSRLKFYLPRILSIRPSGRDAKELKQGLVPPIKNSSSAKRRQKEQKVYDKLTTEENLKIASKLLPLLSDFRAEVYIEWMTVGWVLYNISEGSEQGLNLWLDFSSRCVESFDEIKCRYEWDRMTRTDMTIGTLRYYASVDSPEKYKEFKKENAEKLIKDSLSGSHNDIAKIMFAEWGNEFVCASISGKVWYQFIGHRWETIEEGVFLREKISSVIVNMFREKGRQLFADDNTDDDNANSTKAKALTKVIKDLKNASFKDNVMKEAREVFYDRRFKDKLDNDPYLIGFKNGIYDLKQCVFRSGRPEDFISKCMPINFRHFEDDDEKVQQVHAFFEKVFPDKSLRLYFMDISSEIFVGGNSRKIVPMWLGEGDNGKSVMQMFFENMLGSGLSIKAPTTLITSKKPMSGSAWPELARAGGGVRALWFEEIDKTESIYTGVFKHLSGNDSFVARDLFEKGKDIKEIKPMFKIFCISNEIIQFHGGGDKAVWNRVRCIPFESTFCRESDPAPSTYEEQLQQKRFPMDPDFAKKIPDLVEAFAWVLLEHRKKPKMMIEPEKVRAATNMYRQRNDIYRQFMEECVIEFKGSKLSLVELYTSLRDWFKDSMPGHPVPVKNDVKQYFIRMWGDVESGCKWRGYKIRTIDDDVKAGDVVILGEDDLEPPHINEKKRKGVPPM
jgi:phage/plasmid-associated DNA primase